jgi:hypothetical protein
MDGYKEAPDKGSTPDSEESKYQGALLNYEKNKKHIILS